MAAKSFRATRPETRSTLLVHRHWAWNVLKQFQSKELAATVRLYPRGDESRSKLVELVPAENTPACYGGSCAALPPECFAQLGLDALDAATLGKLWPGERDHLGGYAVQRAVN